MVNEQSLTSLLTELELTENLSVTQFTSRGNSSFEDLLVLLGSLSYYRIRLMERLTLEHGIVFGGLDFENTQDLESTPSMENNFD